MLHPEPCSDDNSVVQYDLSSADSRRGLGAADAGGAVAAADANVWVLNGYGGTLYQFDIATHTRTAVTNTLPSGQPASTMLSVGDYIYAALRSAVSPYDYSNLIRINKDTGVWRTVAGSDTSGHADGGYTDAQFGSITGLAMDGNDLLLSEPLWSLSTPR